MYTICFATHTMCLRVARDRYNRLVCFSKHLTPFGHCNGYRPCSLVDKYLIETNVKGVMMICELHSVCDTKWPMIVDAAVSRTFKEVS